MKAIGAHPAGSMTGGCSPPLVSKRERTALDVKKIRKEIAPEAPFEKTAPVTTVKTTPRATVGWSMMEEHMAAFTANHPGSRFTTRPSKEGSGRVDIYHGGTTIACEVLPSEVQARINRFADRMSRGPSALDQSPTGAPIAGQGPTRPAHIIPCGRL